MAVLDTLPALDVSVCVDDVALPEYDDDDEEQLPENTVSNYVESVSDKEYTIKIILQKGFIMNCPTLVFAVDIDGQPMDSPVIMKSDFRNSIAGHYVKYPITRIVRGKSVAIPGRTDMQRIQNFKFAKIQTTTDDEQLKTISKDSKHISQVGEIKVRVWRGSEGVPDMVAEDSKEIASEVARVHEKALKGQAKSHTTALATPSKPTVRNIVRTTKLDGYDNPLAIFKLKYRSREALKSLLIIERTPTPEPEAEVSPEIENLNAEQRKKLDEFLRGLVNPKGSPAPSIKREREDNGGEGSSRKKRKSGEKIMIDLTDD